MTLRDHILDLHSAGCGPAAIARRLGVSPPTVDYHLARAERRLDPIPRDFEPLPSQPGLPGSTRALVAELLAKGICKAEIARTLSISKSTVTYHARLLGSAVHAPSGRRYDWAEIQRFYAEGHSVRDCMARFGFGSQAWSEAVRRGAVTARPAATPLSDLLVAGVHRGRFNLKTRLVREGLKPGCCERCGLKEWNGERIALALHHINGHRDDNRLENLELLCPNCHSQTDNFAGKKAGADRSSC